MNYWMVGMVRVFASKAFHQIVDLLKNKQSGTLLYFSLAKITLIPTV